MKSKLFPCKSFSFEFKILHTLSPEIKSIFKLAFFSVILIEVILKNWYSPWITFVRLGDLYLKICYSITASVIFYYINQHLPRERKKVKTWKYVHEKLAQIRLESTYILRNLRLSIDIEIDAKVIAKEVGIALSKVDMYSKVGQVPDECSEEFDDWVKYLNYKSSRYHSLIEELCLIEDVIPSDVLEVVLELDSIVSEYRLREPHVKLNTMSMNGYDHVISVMIFNSRQAKKLFLFKSIYEDEYRRRFMEKP